MDKMKAYSQFRKELPSRKVVVGFGDFDAPTAAHELLIKTVETVANERVADHAIFSSVSEESKLPQDRRDYYLKRMFPETNIQVGSSIVEVATALNQKYKSLVLVVGIDELVESKKLLEAHNGKDFKYDTITVVSTGDKTPDSSTMFKIAKKGDVDLFKESLPSNVTSIDARRLMNEMRVAIGVEPLKQEVKLATDWLRESYFRKKIYNIGDIVESNGENYEILDRGSNYLVVVDSDGNTSRKWLDAVTPSIKEQKQIEIPENQIEFKGYVTKNFTAKFAEEFKKIIEENAADPVFVLNSIKEVDANLEEARMSAAMKLQKAFQREQEKSAASRARADKLLGRKSQVGDKIQQPPTETDEYQGSRYVKEGNYDDNRTGFAKRQREDDEYHNEPKPKFKAKEMMDRPHTVHVDNKKWKTFSNGHQAHAAANTLNAKGKKAVAIAHFKEHMAEGLQQTLRKVVPGYAKREIDKKMDAGKFGKTDADKDANFQRYKKIQDKIKEHMAEEAKNPARAPAKPTKPANTTKPATKPEEKEPEPRHIVTVTVSHPDHPMKSKRKETYMRRAFVNAKHQEGAINAALNHYKRQGFKVHDHIYNGKEGTEKVMEHIVKVSGGYELKSKKTGKNLGKSPSRAGALKREREVEYFKHMHEDYIEDTNE